MWSLISLNKIWYALILSWAICGVIGSLAGFIGFFYPFLALFLLMPVTLLVVSIIFLIKKPQHKSVSKSEKALIAIIALWWFLHSLQVFTPETGFDALWYHLPLAQQTVTSHRFVGDPTFYQSFNPQFSDSIFYLGFAVAGELGAKIVAYLFGITLIATVYILSRLFLSRQHSLLAVLLVSNFQVISWQSASFYIDIPNAVWQLSSIVVILKWQRMNINGGFFFGASLATKLFSILLLPVMAIITWINNDKKAVLFFTIASLVVVIPFYLFAEKFSGNAFYSAFHHLDRLTEIGNASSISQYVLERSLSIPMAFYQLVVNREYTTPLLILLFPLLVIFRKKIAGDKKVLSLVIFSLYQLLIWWYLPPTSVRYALSGFITATILVLYFLNSLVKTSQHKQVFFYGLLLAGIIAFPIRLVVANRSLIFLTGQQTKEEYLQQFYDGNVDTVLKKWHKLN
jgi:hypothetical protein